jgi:hypothetical protein
VREFLEGTLVELHSIFVGPGWGRFVDIKGQAPHEHAAGSMDHRGARYRSMESREIVASVARCRNRQVELYAARETRVAKVA